MEIREATTEELDDVSELLRVAWDEYELPGDAHPDVQEGFAAYKARVPDVWSRHEGSLIFVVVDDEGIVGTVNYVTPSTGAEHDRWPVGWAGIRRLGVHPRARGRAIGRALTEFCIGRGRAEGATAVGLHTSDLMFIARGMYERMGFTRVPEHDIHLPPDFVVTAYVLPLTDA